VILITTTRENGGPKSSTGDSEPDQSGTSDETLIGNSWAPSSHSNTMYMFRNNDH
jgi:hypothetical protein